MTASSNDKPRNRSIEVDVEVPGTPEQVWQAIATGPGITAWFVPTEVAEHQGGAVTFHLGAGMDSTGTVTGWDPPRRFAYEEEFQPSEAAGSAPLATEFFVEARAGGTCVVRLVSSVFASGDDWDDQLESMKTGWKSFLQNLRLYLTHFPGQRCATITMMGDVPGPVDRAWAALTGALGLPDAAEGERVATAAPGAPRLAGLVERASAGKDIRELLLRLDEPAPGLAFLAAHAYAGRFYASLHIYLYGDGAPAVAARHEPAWRAWMEERFPSASEVTSEAAAAG